MAASDPTPYVATPTGTLQGVAAFSWDGSAWQPSGRAGPDVATPTGVLQGVAPFSWSGSAWTPAGRAQPGVATPSGVLDGVAVYTWSGSAWTPASGTATPATPTGALRGVAAFSWDGAAWQPVGQARPSVPTPYGVLDGVAMFNWSGTAWAPGAALPPGVTLDLSFMSGTLNPLLTFTRGSTATYFDSSGVMQTTAMNLVTNSGSLADHVVTTATRTLNATVAPDGTTTGTMLTEDATNAEHYMDFSFVPTAAATYTGSVYVKAGTRTQVSIQGRVNGNWTGGNAEMVADLTLGTIVVLTGIPTGTITPVGNGWFRITFTAGVTASPAGSSLFRVALASGGAILYPGNGTGNAYFWGCQLERGSAATTYIPTTTAANGAPRFDNDPVTHAALGLLIEETRINSVRNGNAVGSANGTPGTVPTNWDLTNINVGISRSIIGSGTENGIPYVDVRFFGTMSATGNMASFRVESAVVAVAAQQWSYSAYWRIAAGTMPANNGAAVFFTQTGGTPAGVVVPGTLPTGVFQRISSSVTLPTGTTAVAGEAYIGAASGTVVDITIRFGAAQLEQGAFATSYIPTTAAAVTRSADQCSIQPAQMNFYAVGPGSWMAEFIDLHATASSTAVIVGHNNVNGPIPMFINATQSLAQWNGSDGIPATANTVSIGTVSKGASTTSATAGAVCLNGGGVQSTAFTLNGYNLGVLGTDFLRTNEGGPTQMGAGYIRRVRYWPRVLSNAELQSVTT